MIKQKYNKINNINKVDIFLKPFEVKNYENRWYLINSFKGEINAQVFKNYQEKIYITHM